MDGQVVMRAWAVLGCGVLLSLSSCADDAQPAGNAGAGGGSYGGYTGIGGNAVVVGQTESELRAAIADTKQLDADSLIERDAPKPGANPRFAAANVQGLDRIQNGYFALTEPQLQLALEQGFVIDADPEISELRLRLQHDVRRACAVVRHGGLDLVRHSPLVR
ncbi:MAG: hypothetical protein QM756_01905 [Polyangiaceae bacterium]